MDVWHTKVATTGNINLAAAVSTVDGVNVGWGDLVLVRSQTTASENGIYRANSSGILQRVPDASNAHVISGVVRVSMGSNRGHHKSSNGTGFNKLP